MEYLEVGRLVRINCYGTIYDGVIKSIDNDTIVLEEKCGTSNLIKIIYRHNVAAIELRVMNNVSE